MKLSFVIPTVNQYNMLFDDCIDSLVKHHGSEHEIIVVDDGSTISQDGTPGPLPEKIKAECERRGITFLSNEENSGFAKTVNKGIRASSGDVVVIVNNDVQFTQNVAAPMIESFRMDSKIGITGSLLFYPHGTIQHGGILILNNRTAFAHRGWHRTVHQAPEVLHPSYFVAVTGALFGIRREMIEEIGGFREDYFLAFEDTEFCLRAWEKGWRVYYNPAIRAIHIEGATRGASEVDKQRKARNWYIKEQQTLARFRGDIQKFDWTLIEKSLKTANEAKSAETPQAIGTERIEFSGPSSEKDESEQPLPSSNTIFIRRKMALGDVLMTTGVVRQLRKKYPNKQIVYSTNSMQVLKSNPNIDLLVSTNTDEPEGALVVDLDLAYERDPKRPAWRAYAAAAGVSEEADLSLEMVSTESDAKSLKEKLSGLDLDAEKIVVAHMGMSWPSRSWAPQNWMQLTQLLISRGYKILCVGSGADLAVSGGSGAISLLDKLTLQEIRELCKRAVCFVGADSGILHIAQTTEVPIVGLFTVADPANRIYPRKAGRSVAVVPKIECRYCLHDQPPPVTNLACKFGTNACISAITPVSVLEAIEEVSKS